MSVLAAIYQRAVPPREAVTKMMNSQMMRTPPNRSELLELIAGLSRQLDT